MAGCFGNSMFDRTMESQLFRWLDEQMEYDEWCIAILEKMPDVFYLLHEDWCEEVGGQLDVWLNKLYTKRWITRIEGDLFDHLAKVIVRSHKMFVK